ncbi:unnamed protein product [Meganyctiphanes norvegica]|uniref:TNFR-Cys domain-containing protein n=1 Tax=Meganyctiphanes norvegica TaxID=48144 RepID=A0AAV2SB13_MEGNR
MVGRGWWLLLLSWFMLLLCALCGTWCRSGEEYYNSKAGRCLPCTPCHEPEMVVSVPCYLYQDAVCTPATQFLPPQKKSSIFDVAIFGPKSPVVSESLSNENNHKNTSKIHNAFRKTDENSQSIEKSRSFIQISDLNSELELNNQIDKSSLLITSNSAREKPKKHKQYHKHRHRHLGNHHSFQYLENVYSEGQASLLNNSISDSSIKSLRKSISSSHEEDLMLLTEEIAGATINKDNSDKVVEKKQEVAIKPKTFILYAVVIIGICGVLLIIIIVIHTSRFLRRQRRKGLSTNEHEESNDCLEESDGSEQLLHPDSPPSSSIKDAGKKSLLIEQFKQKLNHEHLFGPV